MDKITTQQFFSKGFKKVGENDWTYKGDKPCVIDFYADWCAPCKSLDIMLKDISKNYNNVNFYKVNVEEEYELTELLNITSIPLIIIVSKSYNPVILSGTISRSKLESCIKSVSMENTIA